MNKKMAQTFPYFYGDETRIFTDEPAVYKFYFGKKYFIWKGKSLKNSVEQNLADVYKLMWSPKIGHAFMPMVEYIRKYRVASCKVEVLVQTSDPRVFLKSEQDILKDGQIDPACLNQVFESQIPKWLEAELATYIPAKKTANKAITATMPVNHGNTSSGKEKQTVPDKKGPGDVNKLLAAFDKANGSKA